MCLKLQMNRFDQNKEFAKQLNLLVLVVIIFCNFYHLWCYCHASLSLCQNIVCFKSKTTEQIVAPSFLGVLSSKFEKIST